MFLLYFPELQLVITLCFFPRCPGTSRCLANLSTTLTFAAPNLSRFLPCDFKSNLGEKLTYGLRAASFIWMLETSYKSNILKPTDFCSPILTPALLYLALPEQS